VVLGTQVSPFAVRLHILNYDCHRLKSFDFEIRASSIHLDHLFCTSFHFPPAVVRVRNSRDMFSCVKLGFRMIVQMRSISTWQGLRWSLSPTSRSPSSGRVETVFPDDTRPRKKHWTEQTTHRTRSRSPTGCPIFPAIQITLRESEAVLCQSHNPPCCQWTAIVHVPRPRQNAAAAERRQDGILHCNSSLWQPCWPISYSKKTDTQQSWTASDCAARPNQQKADPRCSGSRVLEPRA
jgi:hypothetical protein